MKGRILFALMFAALMALGISALNDLQLQKAALPLPERAMVRVASLPPAKTQSASVSAEKALPAPQISGILPQQARTLSQSMPPLLQSYYLFSYQAFHYSDRAG